MAFTAVAILAVDLGGYAWLLFVIIALVVSAIRKLAEAGQVERRRQDALQQPRREEAPPAQTGGIRLGEERERPRTVVRPPGPAPRQTAGQPGGRVVQRLPYRRPAQPVPVRPKPAVQLEPIEPAAVRVTEELAHEQQRRRQEEREHEQRMATAPPMEADTAGIEARLLHVRPMEETVGGMVSVAALVDLSDHDVARKAIILHEVLGPPKGLRQGREMWDP